MGSLLKGTVRSYDALIGTAEVEIVGSHGRYITVPVATHLNADVVTDGKRCAILSFDEQNPGDAVLVATYDDVFGMSAGPLADHDHSGDSGDGGQLEADEALLATSITDGYVLTADGSGACGWEGLQDHTHGVGLNTGGQLLPATALSGYGASEGDVLAISGGAWTPTTPSAGGGTWTFGRWTSTSWDGDTKSDDSGTIDLSAVFGIPAGVTAVAVLLLAQDSATNSRIEIRQTSSSGAYVYLRTLTTGILHSAFGIVKCDSNGDIYFYQATAFDNVHIVILGYYEE